MAELSPQQWREVAQLFEAAVELPEAERAEYLAARCAMAEMREEVLKMLAADGAAASFLEEPPLKYPEPGFEPAEGLAVGQYKLARRLGEGGMGTVWLAERADGAFAALVAIKFSLGGPLTAAAQRRLLEERRILAQLQHPHISRLLDAGAAGPGIPYFVMEYVDGRPLLEYAREAALSEDQRLQLFVDVCLAVHFAHQRLIVHRDLKPANVFVDGSGRVRLLDFGVAKLLHPEAEGAGGGQTVAAFWTPAYASPEQQRGEPVTTAADIYSLGLILRELLTGVRPAAGAQAGQPAADLRAIVGLATEEEAERRYGSAKALAEDVERYRQRQPVLARAPTRAYRFRKFVVRNRALSAVLAAAVAVTLTAVGLFAWQWQAARKAELKAQRNLTTVHRLATDLIFDYHDEIARLPGSTGLRAKLAAEGLRYLQGLAADVAPGESPANLDLEIAEAWLRLGDVQGRPWTANRGDHAAALASYRQSEEWARRALGKLPRAEARDALASALTRQAQLETRLHEWESALRHLEGALAAVSDATLRASALAAQGDALIRGAKGNAAMRQRGVDALERASALAEAVAEKGASTKALLRLRAVIHQRLGNWHARTNPQQGLRHHRDSLKIYETLTRLDPSDRFVLRDYADELSMKAEAQAAAGDRAGALADADRAIEVFERLAKLDPDNLEAKRDLGYAWYSRVAAAGCDPGGLRKTVAIFEEIAKGPASTKDDLESLESLQGRQRQCPGAKP
ncbi:MAG: protein kinase [Acidobacteria bacterium]|nr:protein kinase [Acidobacteriota bacterium]